MNDSSSAVSRMCLIVCQKYDAQQPMAVEQETPGSSIAAHELYGGLTNGWLKI